MYYFWWGIGMVLIMLPVLLSLFTVFLMLTHKADDSYFLDECFWPEDVDQKAKK